MHSRPSGLLHSQLGAQTVHTYQLGTPQRLAPRHLLLLLRTLLWKLLPKITSPLTALQWLRTSRYSTITKSNNQNISNSAHTIVLL